MKYKTFKIPLYPGYLVVMDIDDIGKLPKSMKFPDWIKEKIGDETDAHLVGWIVDQIHKIIKI